MSDEYSAHELLDRLHLVAAAVEDWLLDHPALEDYPQVAADVEAALEALGRAYQAVGKEHLS